MMGRLGSISILVLFLATPLLTMAMPVAEVGTPEEVGPGPAPLDVSSRAPTQNDPHGGSWWEDFEWTGTTADMTGARLIDGKVQLDINPLLWSKHSGNPVLDVSAGEFDSAGVRMNHVMRDEGLFKMWYSGHDTAVWKEGYAYSVDGVNWMKGNGSQPVLEPSASGWDDVNIYQMSVLRDGSTLKGWYSATDGVNGRIGLATSTNGTAWAKDAGNPVFSHDGTGFDAVHVVSPWVMKEDGTYKMWYTGNAGTTAVDRIGYATSNDGVSWNRQANPVLSNGTSGKFDEVGVRDPAIVKVGDDYLMFYTGYNGTEYNIGAAISSDGTTWSRLNGGDAVLENGETTDWDNTTMFEKSVIRLPYGYLMWYAGGPNSSDCRIGLATATSFNASGEMVSEAMDLPQGMGWDELFLKKAEVTGGDITISVLDASDDSPITGYIDLTASGANLSAINDLGITSIRIRATFTGDGSVTPSLYSWGVCWVANDTWRDPLLGTGKSAFPWEAWQRNGEIVLDGDPYNWNKSASNPVISLGAGTAWDSGSVNPGAVLATQTGYLMLYTGSNATNPNQVGLATSADGVNWNKDASNPVMAAGMPGTWDDYSIGVGSLAYGTDGQGEYKAWVSGSDSQEISIGYLVSGDAKAWTEDTSNPVLDYTGGGTWDDYNSQGTGVGSPDVLYQNGTYHMWYHGTTGAGTGWKTGYAWSTDGVTWTKPANSQVLSPSPGKFDSFNAYSPNVMYRRDKFFMFYAGSSGTLPSPGAIGLATSHDWTSWTKQNNGDSILSVGPDGSFDDTRTGSPTVIFDEGVYKMWYGGYNEVAWEVGYAESSFYTSAEVESGILSLPGSNYIWDTLAVNKSEPSGTSVTVDVLDAGTGLVIQGYDDLTGVSVDLTGIDTTLYPSIILRATLAGDGSDTPSLGDWSVNWTRFEMIYEADIPDVSFLEDTFGDDLVDLWGHFNHTPLGPGGLTYDIESNSDPTHIDVVVDSGRFLDFTSLQDNWTGNAVIRVNATDGRMEVLSNFFAVTVTPVNDPPVWSAIPTRYLDGNDAYYNEIDLDLYVTDVDSYSWDIDYRLVAVTRPDAVDVRVDTDGTIDFFTNNTYEGFVTVTVAVTDNIDPEVTTDFQVHITMVPPPNDPPVITSWPSGSAMVGELYEYQIEAYDPDGDALTYYLDDGPTGMTIDAVTGYVSWTPSPWQTGFEWVWVRVEDTGGLSDDQYFSIYVDEPNLPPVITSNATKEVRAGDMWTYTPDIDDPDDWYWDMDLESGPDGMVYDEWSEYFRWTPTEAQVGDHQVSISVTDGFNTVYQNFTITVLPMNHLPDIKPIGDMTTEVGVDLEVKVSASDPDGDSLTYSVFRGPDGLSISSSGTIRWTPTEDDLGKHEVIVVVSDGELSASESFDIMVRERGYGTTSLLGSLWWLILLIIIVVVILVAAFAMSRRKKATPYQQPSAAGGAAYVPPGQRHYQDPYQQQQQQPQYGYGGEQPPVAVPVTGTGYGVAEASRDEVIDDTGQDLGAGPEAGAGGGTDDVALTAIMARLGPGEGTAQQDRIEIDGKRYRKEDLAHSVRSVPKGLPDGLAGKDPDAIAEAMMGGELNATPEGETVIRLFDRYYYGDPAYLSTFLQPYSGPLADGTMAPRAGLRQADTETEHRSQDDEISLDMSRKMS